MYETRTTSMKCSWYMGVVCAAVWLCCRIKLYVDLAWHCVNSLASGLYITHWKENYFIVSRTISLLSASQLYFQWNNSCCSQSMRNHKKHTIVVLFRSILVIFVPISEALRLKIWPPYSFNDDIENYNSEILREKFSKVLSNFRTQF